MELIWLFLSGITWCVMFQRLCIVSPEAVSASGSGSMAEGEDTMGQEDWKEKCFVLETLLMKFRVQIIKIRELTADKVPYVFSSSIKPLEAFKGKKIDITHGSSPHYGFCSSDRV